MNTQMGFGAIERIQKPQDILIGSFTPTIPVVTPTVYMPVYAVAIESQHQTPSCGAHAGDMAKNLLETGFRGSPEYLWKEIRLLDGLTPDDGCNMLTIMQVLSSKGICSFNVLPNDTTVPNSVYADPKTLTSSMDLDASNHKIGVYAFAFNPTFQQIKDAIFTHKSVIMLLRVGSEFWTDKNGVSTWTESGILPLSPNKPITSGHFVVAYAFDANYIYFYNSWSDQWGRIGIGYFGIDYSSRCVEIGTMVNLTINKYIFTKTLRLGSTGFDVKQLQTKLGITADGIFGANTKKAVIVFQLLHYLVGNGIVGINTNKALNL